MEKIRYYYVFNLKKFTKETEQKQVREFWNVKNHVLITT